MRRLFHSLILLMLLSMQLAAAEDAFELNGVYYTDHTDSIIYTYIHKKTGLRVIHEDNANGIYYLDLIFRTPMQDEGDLNHVFEHTVMSGSRKYPSSYLFFDLVDRSLGADIGASTYTGFTEYHFSTPSREQAYIYADVLFSLIDSPDLISNENIYRREAVRYDLDSVDGQFVPSGTVFTEDIGYITSDPHNIINGILDSLYPGCYAANTVGRLPLNLEKNTYDRILEVFGEYYNWDNAAFYVYGDIDIDRILGLIDEEYLSDTDRVGTDLSRFTDEEIPAGYDEAEVQLPRVAGSNGCEYISYAFDIKDFTVPERYMLQMILQLQNRQDSILWQECSRLSIPDVPHAYMDMDTLRPYICFQIDDTDVDYAQSFRDAVDNTIRRIMEGEIESDDIRKLIDDQILAINLSENSGSLYDMNKNIVAASYLAGDGNPFRDFDDALRMLKDKPEVYQELFSRIADDDRRHVLISFTDDFDGYERALDDISAYLAEMKDSATDAELEKAVAATEDFQQFMDISYSNSEVGVPLSDVDDFVFKYDPEIVEKEGVRYCTQSVDDDEFISISIAFDTSDISRDDRYYLGLYDMLIYGISSENMPASEKTDMMVSLLPGLNSSFKYRSDGKPVIEFTALIPAAGTRNQYPKCFNCKELNKIQSSKIYRLSTFCLQNFQPVDKTLSKISRALSSML